MIVTETLTKLFTRDLTRLEGEIANYHSNEALWNTREGIKNSSGTLCLHLCGNLQHYIGAVLGNSGYRRDREAEFSTKDIAKEDLLNEISNTKSIVISTLNMLKTDSLTSTYPEQVFGEPMQTDYFLIHLQGHLNYHLGQINYNRRITL